MGIPLYVVVPVAILAVFILPALFRMRQIRAMPSLSNVSFPEHFAAPPELAGPLPRKTRMTGAGMAPVFMGVVFLIGGSAWFLSCFPAAVQQIARTEVLRRDSRQTTGVVTRLIKKGRGEILMNYAFTAGGVSFTGECYVPWEHWSGLQEAGPLPIRFLPSNPAANHPAAWEGPDIDLWWAVRNRRVPGYHRHLGHVDSAPPGSPVGGARRARRRGCPQMFPGRPGRLGSELSVPHARWDSRGREKRLPQPLGNRLDRLRPLSAARSPAEPGVLLPARGWLTNLHARVPGA
jgi:hypothetical protein